MKNIFRKIIQNFGYDIVKHPNKLKVFPKDFSKRDIEIIKEVLPYTMTSQERLFTLIRAIEYIEKHNIPGDIVECGVWKGGSMMAAAKVLLDEGNPSRHLHLFDTFEGMSEPGEFDINYNGKSATDKFMSTKTSSDTSNWCYSPLEEVKENILRTGYPCEKISFIKGKVEDTLAENSPDKISLLRLDTDWYESTMNELEHLYPRLSSGGVLIIDDYGNWMGAKKAVDEYFTAQNIRMLLNRIDYTGRIGVKI